MGGRRPVPHARSAGGRPAERGRATPVPRQLAARGGRGLAGAAAVLGAARLRRLDRAARGAGRHAVRGAVAAGRGRPPRRPGRVRGAVRRLAGRVRGAQGTKAVGFGWITLRRTGAARARRSSSRSGRTRSSSRSARRSGRTSTARTTCARTTTRRCSPATSGSPTEVVQEQVGLPGAEDPEHVVLRQHRGMRRATKVDTVGAGFAGVCDGTLSAGRILDAIAQLVGEDPVLLRDRTPAADPAAGGAGVPASGGRRLRSHRLLPPTRRRKRPLGAGPRFTCRSYWR